MLAGFEAGFLTDDLVSFNDLLSAVRINHDPLATQQHDATVGLVVDGEVVDKNVWGIRRYLGATERIIQAVEHHAQAGQFKAGGFFGHNSKSVGGGSTAGYDADDLQHVAIRQDGTPRFAGRQRAPIVFDDNLAGFLSE